MCLTCFSPAKGSSNLSSFSDSWSHKSHIVACSSSNKVSRRSEQYFCTRFHSTNSSESLSEDSAGFGGLLEEAGMGVVLGADILRFRDSDIAATGFGFEISTLKIDKIR